MKPVITKVGSTVRLTPRNAMFPGKPVHNPWQAMGQYVNQQSTTGSGTVKTTTGTTPSGGGKIPPSTSHVSDTDGVPSVHNQGVKTTTTTSNSGNVTNTHTTSSTPKVKTPAPKIDVSSKEFQESWTGKVLADAGLDPKTFEAFYNQEHGKIKTVWNKMVAKFKPGTVKAIVSGLKSGNMKQVAKSTAAIQKAWDGSTFESQKLFKMNMAKYIPIALAVNLVMGGSDTDE